MDKHKENGVLSVKWTRSKGTHSAGTHSTGTHSTGMMSFKTRLCMRLAVFVLVCLAIAAVVSIKLSDLQSEADNLDRQAQAITEQIDNQKSEQLEALREMASYSTKRYLEDKARDSYNLIFEGDKIIVIKTSK